MFGAMNPAPSTNGLAPANLVVIGASTGGTRVVTYLLDRLPPLRAAVVIVQHMPKFINLSFARTLARHARSEVRLVQDGDPLQDGAFYLAPSDIHCTVVANRRLRLSPGPDVNYVCPSIDVTMQSLQSPASGQRIIGILLTGMGRDGANGLAYIRKLGGVTIAQNEASCAVYGMPAEAVKLGCVDFELPPDAIVTMLAARLAR